VQPRHFWGEDLELGPTNDLRRVSGTEEGQQRVLRRLLTAPGELVFHPEYGAGLPAYVGALRDLAKIEGLIVSQMLLEATVADDPPPTVKLSPRPDGLFCHIQWADAVTRETQLLAFDLNR
jgi:hypothetical protein